MALRNSCVIVLVIGAGSAFLLNSTTPSTTPINSPSTNQQMINLFNNERHKLELYVASKEQAFNARMFALEQNVNKTVDELAKTTSELNKEKTKSVQLEKEVDRLTMQIYNATMNNNNLQAKVRGLESRNAAIDNNQTALRQYIQQNNIDYDSQLQELKRNDTLLWQRMQNVEQNVTWQINTTRNQTQALSARKFGCIAIRIPYWNFPLMIFWELKKYNTAEEIRCVFDDI